MKIVSLFGLTMRNKSIFWEGSHILTKYDELTTSKVKP